jgi:hypothetical protein
MKTGKLMIAGFIAAAFFLFSLGINSAFAYDYSVNVKNNTNKTATVTVYKKDTATSNPSAGNTYDISAGSSADFWFLAYSGFRSPCPSYLKGTIDGNNISQMSCTGDQTTPGDCCGNNLKFKVIKSGTNYYFQKY